VGLGEAGADGYGENAAEAVEVAKNLMCGKKEASGDD